MLIEAASQFQDSKSGFCLVLYSVRLAPCGSGLHAPLESRVRIVSPALSTDTGHRYSALEYHCLKAGVLPFNAIHVDMSDHVELQNLTFYVQQSAASSVAAVNERDDGPDTSPGLTPGSQDFLSPIPPTPSGSSQHGSGVSEGASGFIRMPPKLLTVGPSPNRTVRRKLKGIHLFVRPTVIFLSAELNVLR